MEKKLKDKINLFRVLHGVDEVWVSTTGELFKDEPENFSGKWLSWYDDKVEEFGITDMSW